MHYLDCVYKEFVDVRYRIGKENIGNSRYITHYFLNYLTNERYIPMRPSTLKDKNGELIYEGDIFVNEEELEGEETITCISVANETRREWYNDNKQPWQRNF